MDQRSKIAVVGYGVEGKAMLKYLIEHKFHDVTVCDKKVRIDDEMPEGVSVSLGKHYLEGLEDFDVIFRSPGVHHDNPAIVEARVMGKDVTSPTQFFLDNCPCTVIGVTGTKGKGTTSTLIYEILKTGLSGGRLKSRKKSGKDVSKRRQEVYLGGNIGNPPIEFLDKLKGSDIVVLELSCFQLGDLSKSPRIAVLLNTTIDHLDYYPDRGAYMMAKELILTHQDKDDLAILNKDYEYVKHYLPLVKGREMFISPKGTVLEDGVYVKSGDVFYAVAGKKEKIMKVRDIALIGSHNLENVCPAIAVAKEFGIATGVIKKVVKKFKGLPHRLEFAGKVAGVSYYNDSFSTNPATSMAAVDSFDVPTVLIAGGHDKGLSYAEWARKILTRPSLEVVVLMGDTSGKMVKAIESAKKKLGNAEATPTKIIVRKGFVDAFKVASDSAVKGGVVVMSPAAASFDQFKDYKERGRIFKNAVTDLKS